MRIPYFGDMNTKSCSGAVSVNQDENIGGQYSLIRYKPTFTGDLIRVGRSCDGGYVINEIALRHTEQLLSFGVNDDWSFETDFLRRNPATRILCFDPSVSKKVFGDRIMDSLDHILSLRFLLGLLSLNFRGARNKASRLKRSGQIYSDFCQFVAQPNIIFVQKGASNETKGSFLKLEDVFHLIPSNKLTRDSVFIKMDIEQSEFRVLPDFLKFRDYLAGFVIEFHDLDILWTNFIRIMDKLLVDFEITHVHGNNSCGLIPKTTIPKFLEVTFIKRALLADQRSTHEPTSYPIPGLDCPNDPALEDYPLRFDL